MGRGYSIVCDHCDYSDEFRLGVGFAYPHVYNSTMEAVKSGKYGRRLKEFVKKHPNGAVDPELVLSRCPKCNRLETVINLSSYLPNPGYDPSNKPRRAWSSVMTCYDIDYISPNNIKHHYSPEKRSMHRCKKCRAETQILTESADFTDTTLLCPQCGEVLVVKQNSMWD